MQDSFKREAVDVELAREVEERATFHVNLDDGGEKGQQRVSWALAGCKRTLDDMTGTRRRRNPSALSYGRRGPPAPPRPLLPPFSRLRRPP